jgi:hypothetical protein
MKKALLLSLLLSTFLWACSGSDSGGSNSGGSGGGGQPQPQPGFTVSADGEEVETLNIATDSPVSLEVKTSGLPSGMAVEITDGGDDGIFAGISSQFTGSDGIAIFTLSTDINFIEEVSGELLLEVENGEEILSLTIPYTVAAWDRKLWGGEAGLNASGLIARTVPFEAPKGLTISAVDPTISGDSVGLQLAVVDGVLQIQAESSVSDGVREIGVYIEGIDEPIPAAFNVVKGDGSEEKPYPIRSADELALIAAPNNEKNFFLEKDIDLSGFTWTPVALFKGRLNGRGYSISGVERNIFTKLDSAKIYDLNITFNITYNRSPVAAFAGEIVGSDISNMILSGSLASTFSGTNDTSTGILAGSISGGSIRGIALDAEISVTLDTRGTAVGMLAARASNGAEFERIAANGSINVVGGSTVNIGSIVGNQSGGTIRDSYSRATIECSNSSNGPYVGGIAGNLNVGNNLVDSVYYNGEIDCVGARIGAAGGIVGRGGEIKNSYTLGKIVITITGATSSNPLYGFAGGIVGAVEAPITNCYSAMEVNGHQYAGGIGGSGTSDIQRSIALNKAVNAQNTARIANNNVNGAYNFAYTDMSLEGSLADSSTKGHNTANGLDITPSDIAANPYLLSDLGFTEDIWDLDFANRSYKLPILKGVGGDQKNFIMPEY